MKKNLRRRTLALILSAIFCLSTSFTVFAASSEPADNSSEFASEVADTYSLGNCVGSNATVTSGYSCELLVYLDQSYYHPYFRAMASGNENNAVDCGVIFPNGYYLDLGVIVANGSRTTLTNYTGTISAGYYRFVFTGTDGGDTGFAGFIYSSN